MHDDAQHHDDAKKKITSNYLLGEFSGSLQSIQLTRDLTPRSTIRRGEELGKLLDLRA
jgi:hypothetical protein